MELSELIEYEGQEWDWIKKLENNLGEKFTQRECFPELNLDERIPYCSMPLPPPTLLPFHKTVIVQIPPFDEEQCKINIQFSVEELLELEKKGRVALVLLHNPSDYANLHYLDPILEKKPPISYRILAYKGYLARKKLNLYAEEARCLFSENPVWMFDEKWRNYILGIEGMFVDLRVCGYDEIADFLVGLSVIEPKLTKLLTSIYSHTLCGDLISYGGNPCN